MSVFEEREKAEARFAKEREMTFRLIAHRNKLLARWAAAKMGFGEARAEQYARNVAVAEATEHGDEALVALLRDDFMTHGLVVPEIDIRQHLELFAKQARAELAPNLAPEQ